jgi:hypothetical protein
VLGIPAFAPSQEPWFTVSNGDVFAAGIGPLGCYDGQHNIIYKGSVSNFFATGTQSSAPGQWQLAGISPSYLFCWDFGSQATSSAPATVARLGYFDRNSLAYLGDILLDSQFPGGSAGITGLYSIVGSATDDDTVYLLKQNLAQSGQGGIWKVSVSSKVATLWTSGLTIANNFPANFTAFSEDLWGIASPADPLHGTVSLTYISRSLTSGTEPVSSIVSDMCNRMGLAAGQYDTSTLTDRCIGYGVTNHSAMRDDIGPLQSAYFFDVVDSEAKLKFVRRGSQPVGTFFYADLGVAESNTAEEAQNPIVITRPDELTLSKEYSMSYYGFQNDYNQNTQYAFRQNTPANKRSTVNAPIVFGDGEAQARVESMLWVEWMNATQYTFSTDLSYMLYEPTDVVWLQDADGTLYLVRLTKCTYDGRSQLKWEAVAEEPSLYPNATYVAPGGGAQGQVPQVIPYSGVSMLQVLDCAPLRDQDNSVGLYVACGGPYPSWRGASLALSRDGTQFSPYASPSQNVPMGYATTVLAAPPFTEGNDVDYVSTVTVQITNGMAVTGTSFQNFLNGVNAAMLGNEIIYFQNVVANGSGSFTLSNLLRGRGGSEWAWGSHAVNERFVALGQWLTPEDLSLNDLKKTVYNRAQTIALGPSTGNVTVATTVQNGRVKPLSPVTLRGFTGTGAYLNWGGNETNTKYQPYGNLGTPTTPGAKDTLVTWLRRGRIGYEWNDGFDALLDESVETYQVGIWTGNSSAPQTLLTTVTVQVPTVAPGNTPLVPAFWFPAAVWGVGGALHASITDGTIVWFVIAQNSDQGVLGQSSQISVTMP